MLILLRPLRSLLLAALILAPSVFVLANMRAAMMRDLGSIGGLRAVPGLTLERERLDFTFDGVFLAAEPEVGHATKKCRVEAVYHLRSEAEHPALFEFIALADEAVLATINGAPVAVQSTPSDFQLQIDLNHRVASKRYTFAFQGTLHSGANDVAVTYLQPLSSREGNLGYFRTPRWTTFVAYDFWPIKAWVRDPAFRADITLSIPRTRPVHDFFFGPSLLLAAEGHARKVLKANRQSWESDLPTEPTPPEDLPCALEKTPGRWVGHFALTGPDLPDLLQLSVTEK